MHSGHSEVPHVMIEEKYAIKLFLHCNVERNGTLYEVFEGQR